MRVCYLLLTAAVTLLSINAATSEAANREQVESSTRNVVQNEYQGARHLRSEGVDADDEERATVVLDGLIQSKEDSKQLISSLASNHAMTVEKVAAYLGINTRLPREQAVLQLNWAAFERFKRLRREGETGLRQYYANFGSGLQTKEKTHEFFNGALIGGTSVENMGTFLGLGGLSKSEQLLHPNWRAFKKYEKMHAQYQAMLKSIQFSNFGSGFHTEEKTKEIMTQWAMAGTRLKDAKQSLHLTGLKGEELKNHVNYDALQLFIQYSEQMKRIRAGMSP